MDLIRNPKIGFGNYDDLKLNSDSTNTKISVLVYLSGPEIYFAK